MIKEKLWQEIPLNMPWLEGHSLKVCLNLYHDHRRKLQYKIYKHKVVIKCKNIKIQNYFKLTSSNNKINDLDPYEIKLTHLKIRWTSS